MAYTQSLWHIVIINMEEKVKVFWSKQAKGYIRSKEVNGLPQRIYLIQTKISKKYSGFRLILKDLKTVKEIIDLLKNSKDQNVLPIIKQSLSFYAVITYGKCFAEAKGRGTQLNKKDALKYADNAASKEHERIIDQRNNYVAHGSLKGYEHNPVVAALNPDDSDKRIIEVYDNIMGLVDIDSQLESFESLLIAVIRYVEEKAKSLMDKIDADLKKENIESLYDNALEISDDELNENK